MRCDHIAHVCTHATYPSARRFTCLHDACCQQDMTLTLRRRACQTHVLLRTGVRFSVQTQGQIELRLCLERGWERVRPRGLLRSVSPPSAGFAR
jgi:hypothetical protein